MPPTPYHRVCTGFTDTDTLATPRAYTLQLQTARAPDRNVAGVRRGTKSVNLSRGGEVSGSMEVWMLSREEVFGAGDVRISVEVRIVRNREESWALGRQVHWIKKDNRYSVYTSLRVVQMAFRGDGVVCGRVARTVCGQGRAFASLGSRDVHDRGPCLSSALNFLCSGTVLGAHHSMRRVTSPPQPPQTLNTAQTSQNASESEWHQPTPYALDTPLNRWRVIHGPGPGEIDTWDGTPTLHNVQHPTRHRFTASDGGSSAVLRAACIDLARYGTHMRLYTAMIFVSVFDPQSGLQVPTPAASPGNVSRAGLSPRRRPTTASAHARSTDTQRPRAREPTHIRVRAYSHQDAVRGHQGIDRIGERGVINEDVFARSHADLGARIVRDRRDRRNTGGLLGGRVRAARSRCRLDGVRTGIQILRAARICVLEHHSEHRRGWMQTTSGQPKRSKSRILQRNRPPNVLRTTGRLYGSTPFYTRPLVTPPLLSLSFYSPFCPLAPTISRRQRKMASRAHPPPSRNQHKLATITVKMPRR
ncbi:hypothetical protein AB1N83_013431 [Pleurotus pulmonarius]